MSSEKLIWRLTFGTADKSKDLDMEFTDTSNILGEPIISREFIDSIIKMTQTNENYDLYKKIKKIYSDKNEDLSNHAIWALLGIVKQNSQRVGLLLGSLLEGSIHLIGSWPDNFTDQLRTDSTLVDIVLNNFIKNPDFWSQVDLIIGNSY